MVLKRRYSSLWPLPSYVFVPGKNPHPKKDGGHMEGEKDPVADKIDPEHPEQNECLKYALDLYNHGYFWESHVYFEALWNSHHRVGSTADFLKAMIKLGAAGVKLSIAQTGSARGHFERAKELIMIVRDEEGSTFLGFDLNHLIATIDEKLANEISCFEVHPDWER